MSKDLVGYGILYNYL